MSGYDLDAYVHSIARREPRRLPACLSICPCNATELAFQFGSVQFSYIVLYTP